MRAGRANDRVAISHQDGNLQVRFGKKRTWPARYWFLNLEHPILRAGRISLFLVSPEPEVKPDVLCPSLCPSLWLNEQTDYIILCNGSHSVGCHGAVWDDCKEEPGVKPGGIHVWLDHLSSQLLSVTTLERVWLFIMGKVICSGIHMEKAV